MGNSKPAVKQTERNPAFADRLSALRLIEELTKKLQAKEDLITELSGEKTTLTLKVGELEVQVQELHSSLLQKDKDVEVSQSFSENLFFLKRSQCLQTDYVSSLSKHVLSASYPTFKCAECKSKLLHDLYEHSNITEFLWPTLSLLLSATILERGSQSSMCDIP